MLIAFLVTFLVVVFFVWATFLNMQLVYAESRKINASAQIQEVLGNIYLNIRTEETAGSSFMLSPNDSSLVAYKLAVSHLLSNTASLTKISSYDTALMPKTAALKNLIIKKTSRLSASIDLYNKNGNPAAVYIKNDSTEKERTNSIRALLELLENKTRDRIIQSGSFQEKIAESTTHQFLVLAFIFLALLAIFFFIIDNSLKRRQQATAQLSYQASLIGSVSDAIISTDNKFIVNGWNKFAEEIYGYTAAEAIGGGIGQLIKLTLGHEDYDKQIKELHLKGNYQDEYEAVKKSGEAIFILASVTLLKNEKGQATGYLAVHRDITERKKLERELKKFNTELSQQVAEKTAAITNILERITDGFLALNSNFVFTFVNKKAGEILGYHPDKMTGKNIWSDFPATVSNVFNNACLLSFETQQYHFLENYYTPADIWIENYIYPSPDGLSVFFKDITFKKKAQLALKESEQHYKNLIDHMPAAVVAHNPDTSIALSNQAAAILLGLPAAQMPGKKAIDPAWHFVTADGTKMEVAQYPVMQVLATGKPIKNLTLGIDSPANKGRVWVFANAFPEFDTAMQLKQVVVTFVDITDHKKTEEELKQREEALNRAQHIAKTGSWELDLDTKELKWSKEQYRIFEMEKHNNPGTLYDSYRKKFRPGELQKLDTAIKRAVETGEGFTLDQHIICNDGSIKNIQAIGETVKDNFGKVTGLKGTGQDVTEIKKAEERLQKSYEEIRQLAAHLQNIREEERTNMAREIHDELGQQLTGLNMYISWLNKKIQPQEEEIKNKFTNTLELIEDTINSVREISTKLRPSMLDDLGLVAAMEWQSHEFEKRSGIKTEFINLTNNCQVPVSLSTGLFRIFQESLTNVARHAAANKIISSLEIKNNIIKLTIADNGKGFVMDEIGSKKTLGLFGMKQRTMVMGGSYEITTSPGNGTIVSITVPLLEENV